jgi:hypothetical protein
VPQFRVLPVEGCRVSRRCPDGHERDYLRAVGDIASIEDVLLGEEGGCPFERFGDAGRPGKEVLEGQLEDILAFTRDPRGGNRIARMCFTPGEGGEQRHRLKEVRVLQFPQDGMGS